MRKRKIQYRHHNIVNKPVLSNTENHFAFLVHQYYFRRLYSVHVWGIRSLLLYDNQRYSNVNVLASLSNIPILIRT